jgi:hypothetical protein
MLDINSQLTLVCGCFPNIVYTSTFFTWFGRTVLVECLYVFPTLSELGVSQFLLGQNTYFPVTPKPSVMPLCSN